MRLFLWNCEPRLSWLLPLPVCTVDKGITRLALQLGSIDIARRWLANWNLAFLERRASCRPLSVSPLTSGSGTLAFVSTLSGSQPQVTGSPRVASLWSPGSVLPTFGEATESARQQSPLPRFYRVFKPRLLSLSHLLSRFYRVFRRLGSSLNFTVTSSRGEAGTAMHDHRDLVVSLPSDAPKLLAVSGHTEEVETTHASVETHSVNPPSQGCTTLTGINLVSLDLGMADQVGRAASSSASQTSFTNPLTMRSFFAAFPPPTKLWFGRCGTPVSSGFTVIVWFTRGPRWVCSSGFSDVSCAPTGYRVSGDRVEYFLFWLLDRFDR